MQIANYGLIGGQPTSEHRLSFVIRHPSSQIQVWIMIPPMIGISQTAPSTQNKLNAAVVSWLQVDPTRDTHVSRLAS